MSPPFLEASRALVSHFHGGHNYPGFDALEGPLRIRVLRHALRANGYPSNYLSRNLVVGNKLTLRLDAFEVSGRVFDDEGSEGWEQISAKALGTLPTPWLAQGHTLEKVIENPKEQLFDVMPSEKVKVFDDVCRRAASWVSGYLDRKSAPSAQFMDPILNQVRNA